MIERKPFDLQIQYAEFLKFIGVIDEGYVWCIRRLRWVKEKDAN